MKLYVDIKKQLNSQLLQVEFEVEAQIAGILGASGCGKSMLLKCIAGVETPDVGQIVLDDRLLFDKRKRINLLPQKRRLGFLFQQYALFPHLTIWQNLTCVTNKKVWLLELLALFHLEKVKDLYPHQLSGGQKQRAAFARMLAAQPAFLLLDEPFSALDTSLKEELQVELQKHLQTFQKSALVVSHSLDELYKLCSDLVIMTEGTTLVGKTQQLFRQPQTVAAAQLTGCKNIWPIQRIDAHHVQVLGWKDPLSVATEVFADCSHIGIRAHDFTTEKKKLNCIDVAFKQALQAPFEQNAWFTHGTTDIWWKGDLRASPVEITQLYLPPSALMPLRNK